MQVVYFGGTILTMEEGKYTEAVLVEDGWIKKTGKKEDIVSSLRQDALMINLEGKTMLPGFIDAHSHITALAQVMGLVQLENVKNFGEIKERFRSYMAEYRPKKGTWIIGFGYDQNFLEEKVHPDKFLLDEITEEHPLLITHKSGHMGVLNSMALKEMSIQSGTPVPEGGKIGRVAGTEEPDGYLEEVAFTAIAGQMGGTAKEDAMENLRLAQEVYFKNGITTIQDGLTKKEEWELLERASGAGILKADVVSYIDIRSSQNLMKEKTAYCNKYNNHLKIGGYKLFLDGSPQGRTAWLSRPYEGKEDKYCGYPIYRDAEVEAYMEASFLEDRQIIVHCNGDAAAQQMIDSCGTAVKKTGKAGLRPVMIHAQMVREDQLERMGRMGIMASFFTAHSYYWGDIHCQNIGERAFHISPAQSAAKLGVIFTFHQDTPVIQPDMLETVWCAVNRISKSGRDMGKDERVSVWEALKAVTVNGAFQYFEEETKGTIREGKIADFVILDKSPLEIKKEDIRSIQVLETIKEGVSVYKKKEQQTGGYTSD